MEPMETNHNDVSEISGQKSTKFFSQKSQPYLYLKLKLSIEDENAGQLEKNQYKFLILQAVKETLGQVGSATPVDLMRVFDDGSSIIRIPHKSSEKVWAALTLYGKSPSGKKCAFRVLHASPFLMSMAFDSRNFGQQPRNSSQ